MKEEVVDVEGESPIARIKNKMFGDGEEDEQKTKEISFNK